MMKKHTPGPWQWVADGAGPQDDYGCEARGPIDISTYRAPGYYNNAEMDGANGEKVLGCGEYQVIHGATPEERTANARLIAAAPDLLAALESAWEWALVNQKRAGTLDVKKIHDAIAKATGA